MGVEATTHQIGENSYTITTFPAGEAIKLWTRLSKIVGPALGQMADAVDLGSGVSMDQEIGGQAISHAVKLLVDQLDEDDTLNLIKRLLGSTHVSLNGENGTIELAVVDRFDAHFAGGKGLAEMARLVAKVLEVNYSDFLSDLTSAGAAGMSMFGPAKEEPAKLEAVGE